jgi:hypothetical protein
MQGEKLLAQWRRRSLVLESTGLVGAPLWRSYQLER